MFTTKEATVLRQLCKEFKDAVADFPWEDEKTVILGSVAAWRACFPRARWASVIQWGAGGGRRTTPVVDADFVHFVGLRRLDMSRSKGITDAAFMHLKGIHTLDMQMCSQLTITDAAFVHLKGIHTLNMWGCYQPTITDAAFTHLKGIHTLNLNMGCCSQATITSAAFVHLKGIHSLGLFDCTQLSSAVFTHLKGIKRLNIGCCDNLTLTEDSLKGIEWLGMSYLSEAHVEKAQSLGYPVDQKDNDGV